MEKRRGEEGQMRIEENVIRKKGREERRGEERRKNKSWQGR